MRETQSYKAAQDPRRGLRKLPQRTEKGPQKGKKKKNSPTGKRVAHACPIHLLLFLE